MRLKDKVAVVTGSASGIGRAVVNRFAAEGAIAIIVDKNEAAIPAVVKEIEAAGGRAAGYAVDITKRDQLRKFVDEVIAKFGRIDILVNNAGVTRYRPFLEAGDEDWDLVLSVDLKAVFFCVQAVAPHMVRQKYGKIVNISSSLGTGAAPHLTAGSPAGSAAYASAKAAVNQLTQTLARELGPSGVTVNSIAPGTFLTPITAATRTPEQVKEHLEYRAKSTVLQRVGTLDELVGPILFFASDESSYVTARTLFVDGGRSDRL